MSGAEDLNKLLNGLLHEGLFKAAQSGPGQGAEDHLSPVMSDQRRLVLEVDLKAFTQLILLVALLDHFVQRLQLLARRTLGHHCQSLVRDVCSVFRQASCANLVWGCLEE